MGIAFSKARVCDGMSFLFFGVVIFAALGSSLAEHRLHPINTELRISLGLVYENNGVETISLRLEPSARVSRDR